MSGIGLRLKKERLRLKLSQSTLGTLGGVETNTQSNYENGTRSPKADYLSLIANAGIDVAYVVTGFSIKRARPLLKTPEAEASEHLNRAIAQLHKNLHEVTQNVYHVTRLIDDFADKDFDNAQAGLIKADAEAITLAIVRLIYKTSNAS